MGVSLNSMGTQFLSLFPLQGDNPVIYRDLLDKCIPFLPDAHAIPTAWNVLTLPLCLAEVI